MNEQAQALAQQGRHADALELGKQAVEALRALLPPGDLNLAVAITNLGFYYANVNQWRAALACYTEGLQLKLAREGPDSPGCATTMFHVARCHAALGEIDPAVENYGDAIRIFESHPAANPAFHLRALKQLASLLEGAGRNGEALPVLRKGIRLAAARAGAGDRESYASLNELCVACISERDLDELSIALAETSGEVKAWLYLDTLAADLVERARPRATAIPATPDDPEWLRDQKAATQAVSQQLDTAPALAQKAYETATRKFGARSVAAALSSNLVAVSHQERGRVEEALPWLTECLEAMRATVPRGEPVYSTLLRDTARALRELKRFDEARVLLREAIEIERARPAVNPRALALAIHDLGDSFASARDPAAAAAAFDEAIAALPPDDQLRDVLEIRSRASTWIVVSKSEMRPEHKATLASLAARQANATPALLAEAESLQAETRPYLHQKSLEAMMLLSLTGRLRFDLGQKDEGLSILERARQIARLNHPEMAAGFASEALARAYSAVGRDREAEPVWAETVDFFTRRLGASDSRTLDALNARGLALFHIGRYAESEKLLSDACNELRKQSANGRDLAVAIGNLAVVYRHDGKFKEAEPLYDESTELVRQACGEDSEDYAKAINNAALFCQEFGLDEKARNLYEKALAILDRIGPPQSAERARVLNNLALLLSDFGDHQRAEQLLLEACAIRRSVLGEGHFDYQSSLHNLGCVLHSLGRDREALATLTEALELKEKTAGPDQVTAAFSLSLMAEVCDGLGETERARALFERSTAIRKKALGDRHPATAKALGMLAQFHWLHGEIDPARARFAEALEIFRYLVRDLFPGMTESERAHYWDEIRIVFEVFTIFALDVFAGHPEVAGDLYDLQLFSRALVLESVVDARRSVAASHDPELRSLYEKWLAKKRELASSVTVRGAPLRQGAEELAAEADQLEKELARTWRPFARKAALAEATWRDVQRRLGPGDAAIEIVWARRGQHPAAKESVYAALVLRPDTVDGPRLIEIGATDVLEGEALERYRETAGTISTASYRDYWESLARELPGITRAYLSPDGVYGLVDLNVLYDGERFLLDALDLRVVTCTRELLEDPAPGTGSRTAALFGRPSYDRAPAEPVVSETSAADGPAQSPSLRFNDLPGTETEVREIETVLRGSEWEVVVFLREQACRAALRRVRSPQLLHLATHGFFLDSGNTRYQRPDGETMLLSDEQSGTPQAGRAAFEQVLSESGWRKQSGIVELRAADRFGLILNPLFRGGLALAGASMGASGDDGLFTAYEASSLDLGETQLVTLSACESARGVARTGEGVIGLGRAFRAAGARYVLAAVWPVDDTIARELMRSFYSGWLAAGDLRQAFRASVQDLRARYQLPMLWSGFVLVGR
jgi:tetratricopeptide (TPR) repeat protein